MLMSCELRGKRWDRERYSTVDIIIPAQDNIRQGKKKTGVHIKVVGIWHLMARYCLPTVLLKNIAWNMLRDEWYHPRQFQNNG